MRTILAVQPTSAQVGGARHNLRIRRLEGFESLRARHVSAGKRAYPRADVIFFPATDAAIFHNCRVILWRRASASRPCSRSSVLAWT
jgi:hypothetical protein